MPSTQTPATLDDLDRVEGKAELIGGRIVPIRPCGWLPGHLALEIAASLHGFVEQHRIGVAFGGGNLDAIDPPLASGRASFSPDASYYVGPRQANRMRLIDGPPTCGVEVRDEPESGEAAESILMAKRTDDFAAGTLMVWDVDTMAGRIASYRVDASVPVALFGPGQVADAEPAVPGWRVAVDDLFR